jgi:hypothetical protein
MTQTLPAQIYTDFILINKKTEHIKNQIGFIKKGYPFQGQPFPHYYL